MAGVNESNRQLVPTGRFDRRNTPASIGKIFTARRWSQTTNATVVSRQRLSTVRGAVFVIVPKPNQAAAATLLSLVCSLASATIYYNPFTTASCCLGTAPYGSTSVGQTFTTAAGTLTAWSFFGGNSFNSTLPEPISGNLQLVIAGWDGSKAVGPALYTSPTVAYNYDPSEGPNVIKEFAFNGIDTSLAAGTYIAYLTVAGVSNPTQAFSFGISGWNDGLPGALRFKDSNGVDPLSLSTPWSILSANPTLSMAYSATIEAAPVAEPSTYAMTLMGLGLLTAFARRKKSMFYRAG
ncbi:PEP-CTERM sorting domain-containing protein [Roseateles agri]